MRSPTARRPGDDQLPNWPIAGARPPHAVDAEPHASVVPAPQALAALTAQPPVVPGPAAFDPPRLLPQPPPWPLVNPEHPVTPPAGSSPPASQRPEDSSPAAPSPDESLSAAQRPEDSLPAALRPEDEPTEPIEGLTARGGDTDEPTLELPLGELRPGPAGGPGPRWMIGAGIAAALLVLAGAVVVVFGRAESVAAAYRDGTGTAPVVSAVRDARTASGLDLAGGATSITVRTADLGPDLYRISPPAATPQVRDQAGRIRLDVRDPGPDGVEVLLSEAVRWDLRVGAGTSLSTLDLGRAQLTAVDLAGGASRINLTLPRPDGTLTVKMSGGVSRFDVHTADRVPVRVRVGSGAGQVVLDGTSHSGVAAGALFSTARWDQSVNRIDVNAVAGMSALTVGP